MLVLKFDICTEDNCKRFVFTETTGSYVLASNPTGWGNPNPNPALATSATLDIYSPSNSTTTPSLTIDLLVNGYPDITGTVEYTITNTALGYSGRVADGIWKFVYTVVVGGDTYKQTIQKATTCNAKCCIDGLFGDIEDFECDCMEAAISKALTAQAIYKAMVGAGACGNITKFNKLKSMLERMCNNQDCCS